MVIYSRGKYISLADLVGGDIADDEIISVSRLTVNLRIVELSSSSGKASYAKLEKLINIIDKPSIVKHRDFVTSYYMSAKDAKYIFQGESTR